MKVTIHHADGTITEQTVEITPELMASLKAHQDEWKRLSEQGTPYWCEHKGRTVTDPAAYFWEDHPRNRVYKKHGVRCSECGGYIQEG